MYRHASRWINLRHILSRSVRTCSRSVRKASDTAFHPSMSIVEGVQFFISVCTCCSGLGCGALLMTCHPQNPTGMPSTLQTFKKRSESSLIVFSNVSVFQWMTSSICDPVIVLYWGNIMRYSGPLCIAGTWTWRAMLAASSNWTSEIANDILTSTASRYQAATHLVIGISGLLMFGFASE